MSRNLSNAAGGEFATRFQCGGEALSYAKTFLDKGMSYQAAARASGVNELTLRGMFERKPAPIVVTIKEPEPVAELVVNLPTTIGQVERRKRRPGARAHGACSDVTFEIIRMVAATGGLTVKDLVGCRARRDVSWVRQVAYYEVHKQRPNLSIAEIGRIFNRDHTTVIYGIVKVEAAIAWAEVFLLLTTDQPDLFAMRRAA